MNTELKSILDYYVDIINRPEFVKDDPVQFPRRFSDKRDIEITSLLTSTIAWGRRPMILRDAERMLEMMDWQPYHYVIEQGWRELPDRQNIHRTFFSENLKHYLAGLYNIYNRHATLEDFAAETLRDADSNHPWHLAASICREIAEANDGCPDSRCLPVNLDNSALKRFNMALRWLVRDDGIVDMGIWHVLKPSQLYIPLDVHVGNVSRRLGLLERKANDRKSVDEITRKLREFCPYDPVRYDFALFGLGVAQKEEDLAKCQNFS